MSLLPVPLNAVPTECIYTVGTAFSYNTLIKSFKELQFFNVINIGSNTFRNSSIQLIELPTTLANMGTSPLNYINHVVTVVFHSTSVPSYGGSKTSYFFGANTFGVCYVPDSAVDDYKAYYTKYNIKPLSEYTG